jgi:tRNA(Arg) A34 adenosine deaminase TadA
MAEKQTCFVEVRQAGDTKSQGAPPLEVEAYVSSVEPKHCGTVIKQLAALCPLRLLPAEKEDQEAAIGKANHGSADVCLGHLKRVRRPVSFGDGAHSKSKKRQRSSNGKRHGDTNSKKKAPLIEVVVGTTKRVDALLQERRHGGSNPLQQMIDQYGLLLVERILPGRPAKSSKELDRWNARTSEKYQGVGWWPTIFFNKQTVEFMEEKKKLSVHELKEMAAGMMAAVADGKEARRMQSRALDGAATSNNAAASAISGVAIVDPGRGVVSSSCQERKIQLLASDAHPVDRPGATKNLPDWANPLSSSIILAIQGVSRKERSTASGKGMDSDDFKNGQYLCTGYDIYVTTEPDIFEAMAITHSRFRRVIYGIRNSSTGGLGGTGSTTAVYSLPGTNHHYRVFQCISKDIIAECK